MNEVVKKTLKDVGGLVKDGCAIVFPIVVTALFNGAVGHAISKYGISSSVGYDDAVKAILKSGMFSDDKQKAVSALKMYKQEAFYEAVISIVNSSAYSCDKLKMIQDMNS